MVKALGFSLGLYGRQPAPGNLAAAWEGNANDASSVTWSAFGRSFTSGLAPLLNDFRVDFAPRTADARRPGVARSPFPNCYVAVWRDKRPGNYYDLFTRLVVAAPQPPQ